MARKQGLAPAGREQPAAGRLGYIALCVAAALLAGTGAASAKMGGCTLQVDGRTCLDGHCNIDLGAGGDFSVGTGGADRSRFVARDLDGTARGHWGAGSGSHAHDSLGQIKRQGACWMNERARVCARAAP